MARRELSNTARRTLEDVYKELMKAEKHLTMLTNGGGGGDMTRTGIIATAAQAQLAIRQARECITSVHPNARTIVLQQRHEATHDD
jgi:hypothetical protein